MAGIFKRSFNMLKEVFEEFTDDDALSMAASLSYYTVFSLPALLVIVITILAAVFGQDAAQGQIQSQVSALMGDAAATEIQTMIASASSKMSGSIVQIIIGIGALVFGATGAFAQLQRALNRAWEVEPDPEKGGVMKMILKRLLSFGMVVFIGFLLLVALVVSAAISAFGAMLENVLPSALTTPVLYVINTLVSLGVITLLFAAIYKVLPDVKIRWKDVWVGAFATAILFAVGKFLIGLYIGNSNPASAYGAAGSLVLILLWIYYSSIILFLGAEFTQVWAKAHGARIRPDSDAVQVLQRKDHVRNGEAVESSQSKRRRERHAKYEQKQ